MSYEPTTMTCRCDDVEFTDDGTPVAVRCQIHDRPHHVGVRAVPVIIEHPNVVRERYADRGRRVVGRKIRQMRDVLRRELGARRGRKWSSKFRARHRAQSI